MKRSKLAFALVLLLGVCLCRPAAADPDDTIFIPFLHVPAAILAYGTMLGFSAYDLQVLEQPSRGALIAEICTASVLLAGSTGLLAWMESDSPTEGLQVANRSVFIPMMVVASALVVHGAVMLDRQRREASAADAQALLRAPPLPSVPARTGLSLAPAPAGGSVLWSGRF